MIVAMAASRAEMEKEAILPKAVEFTQVVGNGESLNGVRVVFSARLNQDPFHSGMTLWGPKVGNVQSLAVFRGLNSAEIKLQPENEQMLSRWITENAAELTKLENTKTRQRQIRALAFGFQQFSGLLVQVECVVRFGNLRLHPWDTQDTSETLYLEVLSITEAKPTEK